MTITTDLRQKDEKELRRILQSARMELTRFSSQLAEGSLKDRSVLGKKRKEIARILSVLREKEILREVEEDAPTKDGKKAA